MDSQKKKCAELQNKSVLEFIRLNVVDVSQTVTFSFNYFRIHMQIVMQLFVFIFVQCFQKKTPDNNGTHYFSAHEYDLYMNETCLSSQTKKIYDCIVYTLFFF